MRERTAYQVDRVVVQNTSGSTFWKTNRASHWPDQLVCIVAAVYTLPAARALRPVGLADGSSPREDTLFVASTGAICHFCGQSDP